MKDMKQLHADHALALVAEASAKDKLDAAQKEYDKLLAKFEQQHTDVVDHLKLAREKHSEAKEATKAVDGAVRDLIGQNKWDDLPVGYEQIRRKKVVYTEDILLKAAIQHAPFLLSIDQKKVEKFAFAICEEITESSNGEKLEEPYFELPDHYWQWLPTLHVYFDYAPRISNTKVQKAAPESVQTSLNRFDLIVKDSVLRHAPKNDNETLCGKAIDWSWGAKEVSPQCPECLSLYEGTGKDDTASKLVANTEKPSSVTTETYVDNARAAIESYIDNFYDSPIDIDDNPFDVKPKQPATTAQPGNETTE